MKTGHKMPQKLKVFWCSDFGCQVFRWLQLQLHLYHHRNVEYQLVLLNFFFVLQSFSFVVQNISFDLLVEYQVHRGIALQWHRILNMLRCNATTMHVQNEQKSGEFQLFLQNFQLVIEIHWYFCVAQNSTRPSKVT